MGYERTLVTRWTRRDWLAIAVIALTTTFLVGTSIMILATSSQIEGEVQALDGLESVEYADGSVVGGGDSDVTLPVARATTANGSPVTVVGLPNETVVLSSSFDETKLSAPPPRGVAAHGTAEGSTIRLEGATGSTTLTVRAASNRSVLPDRWYTARPSAVRELGRTGGFRIGRSANATNTSELPDTGTLLLGTPGFLVLGGGEIVALLGLVTLASGLLIGVSVYSVTRMTVRDRRRALFVVRSTGGTRARLVGLFSVRAGLLTAVGSAFGYALGIILINAVLNVAAYYGTLTTVDISGSPSDRLVLAAMFVALIAIGLGAGAVSVLRTAAASPASLMSAGAGVAGTDGLAARLREAVGMEVIGLRTVVPMTAALTVLIAIAVVSVSVGLTLAPIAGATDGVVMSPDAGYPLQSEVDQDLAVSFRAGGIPASPEVLLPQVRDGQPYVLRGVNYSAYREVSDVSVTAGREPTAMDEALIGEGLARTLDVEVGDNVTVGGGTAFGIDRVTIVGRFAGSGYLDDQLLISLGAAKQLANMNDGTVQIIRTTGVEEPPDSGNQTPAPTPANITVTGVSVPETGVVNRSVPVTVSLENRGDLAGNRTLAVPVNGSEQETRVPVEGNETRTVTLEASFRTPGNITFAVGGVNASLTVEPTPADVVVTDVSVPETGIVNRSVPVRVTLENRGGRAGNLTLTVPNEGTSHETTVTLNGSQKRSIVLTARFDATGTYNVTVGGIESSIRIVEPSPADIVVTGVSVPETGFVNRSVPVGVTLENRGDLAGSRTLTVPVNGTARATDVTVQGQRSRTVTLSATFGSTGSDTITVGGIDAVVEIVEPVPADIVVTDVSVPETGFVNRSVPVRVTLENRGNLPGSRTLTVPVNGTARATDVTVQGQRSRTITLSAAFQSTGSNTITVGGIDAVVEIIRLVPADIVVTNVSVPELRGADTDVPIEVTVENRGDLAGTTTFAVPFNGTERETNVTVAGNRERTVTRNASFVSPGEYALTIAGQDARIRIVDPSTVSLSPLPRRAPPDATLVVTARNRTDAVVPGLRFRLGDGRTRTNANGTARIRVPGDPGAYRIESVIGDRVVHNRSLEVVADRNRSFLVTLGVQPEQVTFPGDVDVSVTAYNPWGATLAPDLVVRREGEPVVRRTVELAPGEETSVTTSVDPAARGGQQQVQVVSEGAVLGTATFTIEISDRLVAVLAQQGLYEPGSGLVRSLESLIGNLQVLQVTLVVLALLMGIGSTATVVIQATHARRRTIGVQRVTGASPRDVLAMILGDGLRVGAIASTVGVVSAYVGLTVLVWVGSTVLFGVRIPPLPNPQLVLGVFGGSLVVVAASSVLAALWVLRVSPGALVTSSTQRVPDSDDGPPPGGTEVEG